MKNNRKGFTIVELVIVIAVIAILAAVLIPTFVSLNKKAKIAADTQLAKNLNTALTMADAENKVDSFDEVLAALREAGYIIANINPTTESWYYVWESESNQILLVDETFAVKYNSKEFSKTTVGSTWNFVVSSKAKEAALVAALPEGHGANIVVAIGSVADLKDAIAAGGEIFVDESVVLDKDNLLLFDQGKDIIVNLGNSQLTSDGTLDGIKPIQIQAGNKVTINGGIVGAEGSGVDLDGNTYSTPIQDYPSSTTVINGTQFNITGGGVQFQGTANLNNVTANTYIYCFGNGKVTLDNCVVTKSNDNAIWVTNTIVHEGAPSTYDGTSTLTIKSGKYTGYNTGTGVVGVYGGTIKIEGGDFFGQTGKNMFYVGHAAGKIILSGNCTFNGDTLTKLGKEGIEGICCGNYKVVEDNGTYTITLK